MDLIPYSAIKEMLDKSNTAYNELETISGGKRLGIGDRLFDVTEQECSLGLTPERAERIIDYVEHLKTDTNMTAGECKDIRVMLDGYQKNYGCDTADFEETAFRLMQEIALYAGTKDRRALVTITTLYVDLMSCQKQKISEYFIKSAMERV